MKESTNKRYINQADTEESFNLVRYNNTGEKPLNHEEGKQNLKEEKSVTLRQVTTNTPAFHRSAACQIYARKKGRLGGRRRHQWKGKLIYGSNRFSSFRNEVTSRLQVLNISAMRKKTFAGALHVKYRRVRNLATNGCFC